MQVNSKETQNKAKIMQKKYKYAFDRSQRKIGKIKTIFYNLRSIMNKGGFSVKTLEKMYKGIVQSGDMIENGYKIQFVTVFDNKDKTKLKYQIKYGINGVTVKVSDDVTIAGIHYAKFSDFDCKKLQEVLFNYHVPDRIETYKMLIKEDGEVAIKFSYKDKENLNFLGKLWKFLRDRKYIY